MKIIITGSHGVGKTTLSKQIIEYLNRSNIHKFQDITKVSNRNLNKFEYLEDAPAQALKMGFKMNKESNLETELWIFAKQLEMEMNYPKNTVGDKGFIDLLAYAFYLFKDDQNLLNILRRIAIPKINTYDLVIYLPTGEFPIPDDGKRSLDPIFQSNIDNEIIKIMHEHKINYTRIVGSTELRLRKAIELLEGVRNI